MNQQLASDLYDILMEHRAVYPRIDVKDTGTTVPCTCGRSVEVGPHEMVNQAHARHVAMVMADRIEALHGA